MVSHGLRREEKVGLAVAAGLHLALLAALLLQPPTREPISQPQRIAVSLATDVGLEATAPEPVPESRAAQAPVLAPEPAPQPVPEPPVERTVPKPVEKPLPPVEKAKPAAKPTTAAKPAAKPTTAAKPAAKPTAKPVEKPRNSRPQAQTPPKKAGGSRLGDNFLEGAGSSTSTSETRVPASKIGASAKASLVQAISREIKPHWEPPNGPEVDQITTYLRFRLNADGTLAGRPQVVRQTGVNDTNRAQAGRHGEQAIRAVQLAAPFDLPPEYYEAWKLVGPFGFDWKLAQ